MEKLVLLREQLDQIDQSLLELLAKRKSVIHDVGTIKAHAGLPIVQADREAALYRSRSDSGQALGLDPDFVVGIWRLIHDESCRYQEMVVDRVKGRGDAISAKPL